MTSPTSRKHHFSRFGLTKREQEALNAPGFADFLLPPDDREHFPALYVLISEGSVHKAMLTATKQIITMLHAQVTAGRTVSTLDIAEIAHPLTGVFANLDHKSEAYAQCESVIKRYVHAKHLAGEKDEAHENGAHHAIRSKFRAFPELAEQLIHMDDMQLHEWRIPHEVVAYYALDNLIGYSVRQFKNAFDIQPEIRQLYSDPPKVIKAR